MGAAAYNRGSRCISEQIDREQSSRRILVRCAGRMRNGPGKRFARCDKCGQIDWELNEGDPCRGFVREQ
ncbi:MAG: hypothetical protein PHU54_08595 [Candidatus Omnitrophica bacterium]|jgi:hypothetical protein|nr:hypothetical protein [Candidatus Omnitrophota bacterium]